MHAAAAVVIVVAIESQAADFICIVAVYGAGGIVELSWKLYECVKWHLIHLPVQESPLVLLCSTGRINAGDSCSSPHMYNPGTICVWIFMGCNFAGSQKDGSGLPDHQDPALHPGTINGIC